MTSTQNDPFRLDGKTALVTGSNTGIGAAIAMSMAQAGAKVVCHGRRDAAEETVAAINGAGFSAVGIQADLGNRDSRATVLEQVTEKAGPVDVLVNNAGTIARAPATEYPMEDWDRLLEVNLTSISPSAKSSAKPWWKRAKAAS